MIHQGIKTWAWLTILWGLPLIGWTAQYSVIIIDNPAPVDVLAINDNGAVVGSASPDNTRVSAHLWTLTANAVTQGLDLGIAGCPLDNILSCYSEAYGLNDNSPPQVAGISHADFFYAYSPVPFMWDNGQMRLLLTIGLEYSQAEDVNNQKNVVGFGRDTFDYSYADHAYILYADGEVKKLLGPQSDWYSRAFAVNDNNVVAGCISPDSVSTNPAYWEDPNGDRQFEMVQLPGLGGNQACIMDVNANGAMAGEARNANGVFRAAFWQNGQVQNLGSLGDDGDMSYGTGINDQNQVVGHSRAPVQVCRRFFCYTLKQRRAFIWENGVMTKLDDLMAPGEEYAVWEAYDINNAGQILAFVADANNTGYFAILNPQ